MKPDWLKIASVAIPLATIGLSKLSSIVESKVLDEHIAKAVEEALKAQKKES